MVAYPTAEGHEWPIAIIPVLDLMGGQVVRARAGLREHYAPIQHIKGSDPFIFLPFMLQRSRAAIAYIADLDGIMHGKVQWALLNQIAADFSEIQMWLDAGFQSFAQAQQAIHASVHGEGSPKYSSLAGASSVAEGGWHNPFVPVLGTETLLALEDLSRFSEECILSLDYGSEGFRGDSAWLSCHEYWPSRVIVMSLPNVGAEEGPDDKALKTALMSAQKCANPPQIFAAGGVDFKHTHPLSVLGVSGALMATALHALP